MEKQKVEIEIPDYILTATRRTTKELIRQMKALTALHLYLSEEISLEMAAEFSEKSKWEFEDFLAKNKIPISLIDFDDYKDELKVIENL
jgi:predicted HTH domain antitoxin